MRQALAVNRNHSEEPMFEREGKSVATEQGAGVEGCDPAHMHLGGESMTALAQRGSRARVRPLSSSGDRGRWLLRISWS